MWHRLLHANLMYCDILTNIVTMLAVRTLGRLTMAVNDSFVHSVRLNARCDRLANAVAEASE